MRLDADREGIPMQLKAMGLAQILADGAGWKLPCVAPKVNSAMDCVASTPWWLHMPK